MAGGAGPAAARNLFRERVYPLPAINKRDRLAEALPGDVAEPLEMRLCAGGVSRILLQLRKAIFRRRLQWINCDRALKFGRGFIEMTGLRVEKPEEILGNGVVGVERGGFPEIGERRGGVARGAFEQREIEPCARALRIALDGCFKNAARVVVAAHVEKGDPGVEAADVGLRIEDAGGLEIAERLIELAAIHQNEANVVGAKRFGVGERRWRRSGRRGRGFRRLRGSFRWGLIRVLPRLAAGEGGTSERAGDGGRCECEASDGGAASVCLVRFGEMAGLEARLEDAENRVAPDHADDVAVGEDGHLVDVLFLHALEDVQHGLFGQRGMDAIDRDHHGLDRGVGPLIARYGARRVEGDEADRRARAGDDVERRPVRRTSWM